MGNTSKSITRRTPPAADASAAPSGAREISAEISADDSGPFAIEVENLSKQYSGMPFPAVKDMNFRVRAGEIFGLLGPNGAGKSTIIGILTTRLLPSAGRAVVAGFDVSHDHVSVKKNIAVVPQASNLDRSLSPRENLTFHAAYFGVPRDVREQRANELMERLGLKNWKKQDLGRFSGGMAQRVMIARALMTEPSVIFLDEPTTGLDPQSRLFLWERITEVNARGVSVVLTTHDMDEADKLCHRVGIVDHGKLLALGTPGELKNMVPGGSRLEVVVAECERAILESYVRRLRQIRGIERAEIVEEQTAPAPDAVPSSSPFPFAFGFAAGGAPPPRRAKREDGILLRLYTSSLELTEEIIASARESGIAVRELRQEKPSLENLFLFLTGRELRA